MVVSISLDISERHQWTPSASWGSVSHIRCLLSHEGDTPTVRCVCTPLGLPSAIVWSFSGKDSQAIVDFAELRINLSVHLSRKECLKPRLAHLQVCLNLTLILSSSQPSVGFAFAMNVKDESRAPFPGPPLVPPSSPFQPSRWSTTQDPSRWLSPALLNVRPLDQIRYQLWIQPI